MKNPLERTKVKQTRAGCRTMMAPSFLGASRAGKRRLSHSGHTIAKGERVLPALAFFLLTALAAARSNSDMPKWRNWQTR